METKVAVELFQELGLTLYEARGYVAVLANPGAAPSVVARAARIPRQRVYDVLGRLLNRGFVIRTSARRVTYRAVTAKDVLTRLKREEETKRTKKEAAAATLRAILEDIAAGAPAEAPREEYVEIIKNPALTFSRQDRLWQEARARVVGCSKAPYIMPLIPPAKLEKAAAKIVKALKRGVAWRTIFEAQDAAELAGCDAVNYFVARGEKVRFLPRLPIKMSVFDGKESFISLEAEGTGEPTVTVLAIAHRGLAAALESHFEKLWAEATPFEPRKTAAPQKKKTKKR